MVSFSELLPYSVAPKPAGGSDKFYDFKNVTNIFFESNIF